MTAATDRTDPLRSIDTLSGLRAAFAARVPTLPEAQEAAAQARALVPAPRRATLAIVRSYTSELLDPWIHFVCALQGFELAVHHAPYGALQPGADLVGQAPDLTCLLLQRADLHPAFAAPVVGLSEAQLAAVRSEALERLHGIVSGLRAQPMGQLLISLLPASGAPALGAYDAQAEMSEYRWWTALEADIAAWLRAEVPAASLMDTADAVREVGRRRFFDARLWHSSRYPFAPEGAIEIARRIVATAVALKAPRAKVIVVDADNTLWGGIVGEDGPDGIALGPDYPGSVYVAFQRRLLELQQRGFILALCSKNNPADARQVLAEHPHQLLRESHFAAQRINWEPKPENLRAIAEELNLGLDTFVFVDDSDHECAAVRAQLPQVEVIQVPKRAIDIPTCLDGVMRLEVLSLTAEDRVKTQLYAQERERKALLTAAGGKGERQSDYLERLQMRMRVGIDPLDHLARLAQLTNKTNQFNLTTRRCDELRMREWIESPDWLVADFSLADVFGDSGIVGLAVVQLDGGRARLDNLLMSCRVIGRCAGEAFLHALLRELRARGVTLVEAEYLSTPKNALVRDFLAQQGFARGAGAAWSRDLQDSPAEPASAFPIAIEIDATTTPQAALQP